MGRTTDLTLDLGNLPGDQAETLRNLLEQANFLNIDESPSANAVPDSFSYRITVQTERIEHTISTSDASMPDTLRPLVDELSRLARLQR